jgi:putative RNA 2'-phosphotransferase
VSRVKLSRIMTTQMSIPNDDVRLSRKLSWLLRHGAKDAGVAQTDSGFVAIADVLRVVRCTRPDLERVVRENAKKRFEIVGEEIRAVQGHSTGVVSIDALEASYARYEGPDVILHGTSCNAVPGIAREGISPMSRTHVHLAPHATSIVGKRAAVDLFLEVSVSALAAHGHVVFASPNGVLLVRHVPAACIVGIKPARKGVEGRVAVLAGLFPSR